MKAAIMDTVYAATHPLETLHAYGRQVMTDLGASGPPEGVDIESFVTMPAGRAARLIAEAKKKETPQKIQVNP